MAKKSSTNAVKKLDKQINELKKKSNSKEEKTPVVSKKELKDGIEKAKNTSTTKKNIKKSSSTKKTIAKKSTSSKTPSKKKTATKKTTTKKTVTKTTTKKSTAKKATPKVKKEAIIVAPEKPIKEEKVVKIDKAVRDDVVVAPSKKKEDIIKDKPLKDDVLVTPDKDEKDRKVDDKKDISDGEKVKRILRKEKKFEFVQEEQKEDNDDYKFADDIENDINNGKYIDKAKILIDKSNVDKKIFKRKRKGKNKYIIDLESTKEYKDLERDLRSLYDKTNDIIDDIDKPVRDDIVDINKLDIHDNEIEEKKGILDHISQKVLNVFIAILSVIFIILLIVVIGFIIYVSTV